MKCLKKNPDKEYIIFCGLGGQSTLATKTMQEMGIKNVKNMTGGMTAWKDKKQIVKVYFNNSCKICRAEINLYKKQNIKDIEWVDITNNKSAEIETQTNAKNLLRRLHIKDGEKVIGGAEAFLLVWKKIPKYKFLYSFFKTPIIFTLFSFFYEIIAFFLFLKNKKQLLK